MTAARTSLFGRPLDWLWLLVGTGLLLLSQHGHPDIGIAGWIFAIPLLRFGRSVGVGVGAIAFVLVHLLAGAVWVLSIAIPAEGVPWAAVIGGGALATLLAVPFIIDRLVAVPLRASRPLLATLVFPLAHVGAELLLVTVSPFGAVYGLLAHSQHGNLPLLQVASVTGAVGVGFLMAWVGSAGCELWQRPQRLLPAGVVAAVIVAVLASGAVVLQVPDTAATVRVAGITPSRALENRADELPPRVEVAQHPEVVEDVMEPVTQDLLQSTDREAAAGAEVVVWSEAATLVAEDGLDELLARVGTIARKHQVRVQATAGVFTDSPPYGRNVTAMVGPDGEVAWLYDKVHPVPGVESITPGTEPPPARDTEFGRIAGMICYDLDYADTAGVDADILLLPAADWPGFDKLHTQKAQVRAIEQGYTVVRQDAHGTAAAYDAHGRILGSSDYFRTDQQVLIAEVPTQGERTVYSVVGDLFAYGCLVALAGLTVASVIARRRDRTTARPVR